MRSYDFMLLIIGTSLCLGGPRARADLLVEDWSLTSLVNDGSTGESDVQSFFTVENPFNDSHIANVGISSAWASYASAWSESDNVGSFYAETAQVAEDIDSSTLYSRSSGRITFVPETNLTVTVQSEYAYFLPPDNMWAELLILISARDDPAGAFYSLQRDDSYYGTVSGTFVVGGEFPLIAGHRYDLQYRMTVRSFGGQTGLLATGTGFADFQITPEPATMSLLALAAPLLLGPRKRRR